MKTEDAVKKFLKKHMPIEEQNLTLLKVANRVKKEYPLTVKPKTIMSHIAKILQSDYNTTWDELQMKSLLKHGTECDIYLILSAGFSNGAYHYYLKVGESISWVKQRKSSYLSHNPGINIIGVIHYKGAFTPEMAEKRVRRFLWNLIDVTGEDIVDGTVEWIEISKETYLYFEEHGAGLLQEALKFIPEVVSEGELKEKHKKLDDFNDAEEAKEYFKEYLSKRDQDFPKNLAAYSYFHPQLESPVTFYEMMKLDPLIDNYYKEKDFKDEFIVESRIA